MSATWDSKGVKATPVLDDEILLIDTEDGRNQKRATLSSFGGSLWTRNAGQGFIFPNVITDRVGIGFDGPPDSTLHIRTSTAGTITPDGDSDDLILENDGNTGYTVAPTIVIAAPPTPITATGTAVLGLGVGSVTVGLPTGVGYIEGETIQIFGATSGPTSARGTITLTGLINSVAVVAPGSGYVDAESVTLTGVTSGATDATATVSVTGGQITAINIVSGGTGYTDGETVNVIGGTGTGGTGIATLLGQIATITITIIGSGYTTDEAVTLFGLTSGANNGTATATTTGIVDSITVDIGGSGYGSAPNVTITGGGGTGATATTSIVNTAVTVITVTDAGSGFTSVPTVTIDAAPSPITATADANIAGGKVVSVTMTNVGIGYKLPPPVVEYLGGDGNGVGTDVITILNATVSSITVTTGGTGLTVISATGQVGVLAFETAGSSTTTEKILFDHSTERLRFIIDSLQILSLENNGRVAVSQENVAQPELFTIDSGEVNDPPRMAFRDTFTRLKLGYDGAEAFDFTSDAAQVVVLANSGSLAIATRGNFASNIQFLTSDGASLFRRMVILPDGNIGVNTLAPVEKMYIVNGNFGGAFSESQAARWSLGSTSSSVDLKTLFTTPFNFGTDGITRMTIANTGEIGIGTTLPDATLHVRTLLAGTGVPSEDADDFIIENNGNIGYTVAPIVTIAAPPTPVTALATAVLDIGIGTVTTGLPSGTGYTEGEIVELTGVTSSANDARGTITLTGILGSAAVAAGGTGYVDAESVTLTGVTSGATNATATVSVTAGTITAINIVSGGTGYTAGETLNVIGGTGTGGTGIATLIGEIATITITVIGSGYSTNEALTILGQSSGGSDATATATTTQFVTSITVDTIGSGYATTPNVVISGGGGTGATAVTTLVNTEVTVITVTAGGTGFTSVPTVTVDAAPSPVTATATANISGGKVTSTTITDGGVGYKIPPPNVVISGGDGTGAGVDAITLANSAVTSITITAGGTGMTIFNDAGQVSVIDFEHAGGPTQHGRIMYDHGTQTMRLINTNVQGLLIDDQGHVAVSPDNVSHPEFFTVESEELDMPTRILVADTIDRLLLGYDGNEPLDITNTAAQVVVEGGTNDLVIASRGDVASEIRFFTSNGALGLVKHMTIKSNGFIGIANDVPGARLDVSGGSGNNDFRISRIGNPGAFMFLTSRGGAFNQCIIGNSTVNNIAMRDNGGVAVGTFASQATETPANAFIVGGTVGIGTTTPISTLQITSSETTGGITPDGDADDLIIENDGNTGYTIAPTVSIAAPPTPVTATATATTTGGLRTITLSVNGTRYTTQPVVALTGGGGIDAAASANLLFDNVESIIVNLFGSGYTSSPTVSITGGGGTGATATANISLGVVVSVTVDTPGTGYTSVPTIGFTGGGGSGATAIATLSSKVDTITITNRGSGYTSAPTVTIDASVNGTDAVASSTITNFVDSITVDTIGSGYISAPTITIDAPTGSPTLQATAVTVLVNTQVTIVTITEGGQGYDVIPAVSFTAAPSAVTATATANIAGGKVTGTTITEGGVGYRLPPPVVEFIGGDGNGVGVDVISVSGSAITAITVTPGGTGLSIVSNSGQVGVLAFETAGSSTTTEKILFDHSTERMRFIIDSFQGLIIENNGHVAVSQDNVAHSQVFTVDTDVLNVPTRILVRDSIDRLMLGFNGADPFDVNATFAQVIVPGSTGDLIVASRGDMASQIEFFTSDGSGLVERMHMDSGGNLGINEENPISRLHVTDNVNEIATFESTIGIGRIRIESLSNSGLLHSVGGTSRWSTTAFVASGSAGPNVDYTIFNEQTDILSVFVDGDTDAVGIGGITDPGAAKGLDVLGSGTFAIITREGGIAINRDIASPFISMSEAGTGIMQMRGELFNRSWGVTNASGAVRHMTINTLGDGHAAFNNLHPNGSAQLEIVSTDAGFLHPRMTETQRDAIVSLNVMTNKALVVASNVLTVTGEINIFLDAGIIVGSTVTVSGSDITLANAAHTVLTVDVTTFTATLVDSDATATTPGESTFTEAAAEHLFVSNTDTRTLDYFISPDWRRVSSQGFVVTEIWDVSDFPPPSGSVITLVSGTSMIQKTTTVDDEFALTDLSNITISSVDRENAIISHTIASDTVFTSGTNNGNFNILGVDFFFGGSNNQLLDITKGRVNIDATTVFWDRVGGAIGSLTDCFLPLLNDIVFVQFETGLVVRDFANFQIQNMGFFPRSTATGPFVNISGRTEFIASVGRGGYSTTDTSSAFFVSPDLDGKVVMEDVLNQGSGQFYETAATGVFSGASDDGSVNTIASVSDNGGIAVFDKGSALTNLINDDLLSHSGFSESSYNTTTDLFEVFAITTNTYQVRNVITQVAIAFVSNVSGSGITTLTRILSTAHGLSGGEQVSVFSANFAEGSTVRGTPPANEFELRIPFGADEAGTWEVDLGNFTIVSDESFVKTITAVALAPADGSTPAGARFTVSGGASPMLDRDIVVHTGFTDPQYNGRFFISNVQSGTYDIVSRSNPLVFTVTDSGTSTDQVTRFTSINHGLVAAQGVQITSDSYNLGAGIRGTPGASTFDLPITFVADEFGIWNINSLDQTDPRMTVRDCTGSPDSVTTAEFSFINIATPETVTIGTEAVPVPIAGGAWTANNLERILEPSGGDGIATYNGLEDIEIPISFFCLLEKVGGGATDIGCTILVNGTDVIDNHPHSVNAGVIQITGNAILSLVTGDTVQMAVLNDSGTANIDVSQANMVLSK